MTNNEKNDELGPGQQRARYTYAVWDDVREALRGEILSGEFAPESKLPTEREVASRFGVSRLTARRALADLQREGLIRIEQGRGTFVTNDAIRYRITSRTTFNQDLLARHQTSKRRIVNSKVGTAETEIAELLNISGDGKVICISVLGIIGDVTVSVGYNYFPYALFPDIEATFRQTWSFSQSLEQLGVRELRRVSTTLKARLPTKREARLLKQGPTLPVVETVGIDVDKATDRVVRCNITCFCERMTFSLLHERIAFSLGE